VELVQAGNIPRLRKFLFSEIRVQAFRFEDCYRRGKSGKHKSLNSCFVLRSQSWTLQPWGATTCAQLRRSDSHSPGKLTHRGPGALGAIYQPRDADADCIECDHGSRKQAHIQDVGSGRDDCGNDKNGKDGISQIPPHPAGRYHAHQSKKEDKDWHFED
jgi:hypothetical protein